MLFLTNLKVVSDTINLINYLLIINNYKINLINYQLIISTYFRPSSAEVRLFGLPKYACQSYDARPAGAQAKGNIIVDDTCYTSA